jgi:hypothetical protein
MNSYACCVRSVNFRVFYYFRFRSMFRLTSGLFDFRWTRTGIGWGVIIFEPCQRDCTRVANDYAETEGESRTAPVNNVSNDNQRDWYSRLTVYVYEGYWLTILWLMKFKRATLQHHLVFVNYVLIINILLGNWYNLREPSFISLLTRWSSLALYRIF